MVIGVSVDGIGRLATRAKSPGIYIPGRSRGFDPGLKFRLFQTGSPGLVTGHAFLEGLRAVYGVSVIPFSFIMLRNITPYSMTMSASDARTLVWRLAHEHLRRSIDHRAHPQTFLPSP